MPTLVADVSRDIEIVADALVSSGLRWRSPATHQITVWVTTGDQLLVQSEADAFQQWHAGAVIQLWKNEVEDLVLGHAGSGVRLYFDGCSASDVAAYLSALMARGLPYWVGPEE
jgi:hypothetical protein